MLAIRPMAIAESSRPSFDESLDRRRELEKITLRYFYINLSDTSSVPVIRLMGRTKFGSKALHDSH
jgi:hypothetical protein